MAKAKATTKRKTASKAQGKGAAQASNKGKGKGKAAQAAPANGNATLGVNQQATLQWLQRNSKPVKGKAPQGMGAHNYTPHTSRAVVLGLGRTPGQKQGQPIVNALHALMAAGLVAKVPNAHYRGNTWALTKQGKQAKVS